MTFNFSVDDIKSLGRLACLIAAFGAVQFLLITTIAALLYPGGYDYFNYFFSWLGRVNAVNGDPNPVGQILFMVTCILVAICLLPFWIVIRSVFTETSIEKILAIIGSVVGLLGIPFMIGIGIFPSDTQTAPHISSATNFFLTMAFAIIIYSIAILMNKNYPNYYSILGGFIFVLVLIYVFVDLGAYGAFIQKVIVYSYIIWTIIQLFRIWPLVEPRNKLPAKV
ncbi:MAG: hypothetical protein ACXAC8_11720 [Candidatus Hodarchaeales archaeon]